MTGFQAGEHGDVNHGNASRLRGLRASRAAVTASRARDRPRLYVLPAHHARAVSQDEPNFVSIYLWHRSIKEIVRTLSVSRATVRKVVRGPLTEFKYERGVQPAPKLGDWVEALTEILEKEAKLPKRERRSTQRLFEELRGRGYDGAHDSVHRFVKAWRDERARVSVHAYVPMSFAPGEAYQFDWSHETITLAGLPLTVKAAHMKLSHSRMPFVRVYFRETQELVFDAHDKAFRFYGGVCRRGIYDNMKTAVEAIFVGKARRYNLRFLQMCSHHLIEPVACTPASGWEKGQVENQVGNLRDQMFRPKPRVKSLSTTVAIFS